MDCKCLHVEMYSCILAVSLGDDGILSSLGVSSHTNFRCSQTSRIEVCTEGVGGRVTVVHDCLIVLCVLGGS